MSMSTATTAARWDDDRDVPEELVGRLYRASESAVLDLISRFSLVERANLAVYCYRKAHLYRIGLAIAATCDRETLVETLGTNLGEILYAQSRDRALQLRESSPNVFRAKITLAKITAYQNIADEMPAPQHDDDEDVLAGEDVQVEEDEAVALA